MQSVSSLASEAVSKKGLLPKDNKVVKFRFLNNFPKRAAGFRMDGMTNTLLLTSFLEVSQDLRDVLPRLFDVVLLGKFVGAYGANRSGTACTQDSGKIDYTDAG